MFRWWSEEHTVRTVTLSDVPRAKNGARIDLYAHLKSEALRIFVKYHIAEVIGGEHLSLSEIVERLGGKMHTSNMWRFFALMVREGYLDVDESERYFLTDLGAELQYNELAEQMCSPRVVQTVQNMESLLCNGTAASDVVADDLYVYEIPFDDEFDKIIDLTNVFTCINSVDGPSEFLEALAEKHPHVKIHDTREGDLLIVNNVLCHFGEDDDAMRFIQKCVSKLREQGRAWVIMHNYDASNPDLVAQDVFQMILGGRERSVATVVNLVESAGLFVKTVHRCTGSVVMLDCSVASKLGPEVVITQEVGSEGESSRV